MNDLGRKTLKVISSCTRLDHMPMARKYFALAKKMGVVDTSEIGFFMVKNNIKRIRVRDYCRPVELKIFDKIELKQRQLEFISMWAD